MADPINTREVHLRVRKVCEQQWATVPSLPYDAPMSAYSERSERREAIQRVCDRLNDCFAVARLLGGETLESFDRCLRSCEGGKYTLLPSAEALCLAFTCYGMYGEMVWFERDNTWSMHT